jgi:hypothetical protein
MLRIINEILQNPYVWRLHQSVKIFHLKSKQTNKQTEIPLLNCFDIDNINMQEKCTKKTLLYLYLFIKDNGVYMNNIQLFDFRTIIYIIRKY